MPTKEELEQQLASARKDVEALAAMAGERTQGAIADAESRIEEVTAELSDEARELLEQARLEGQQWRGAVEDHVRKNPLMTLGIAAGAGFILASLLRR